MNGPFPRSAELLLAILADAVARAGDRCFLLDLDEPCNERSDAQWHAFVEHRDSVAFVSWCADKLRYWHTPAYLARQLQSPVLGDVPALGFVIMSPDGNTDWTLAAWQVHARTHSDAPFTEHALADVERSPTIASVADIALLMADALVF